MKKLIVEIDDKYAGVASMTFTGTECKCSKTEINLTVSAVTLDNDITAIAIDADGKKTEVVTKSVIDDDTPIIPLEKLMEAVRQLEDLREEREEISEGLLAGLEDNDFAHDVAAIDTAIAIIPAINSPAATTVVIIKAIRRFSAPPIRLVVRTENIMQLLQP